MDIQAEKLALIQWLAGINDSQVISRFRALKRTSEETVQETLSPAETEAISQGLQSIKAGKVKSQEEVIRLTREKYPQLFR
ncbi:hypothetical protein I2I11_11670 [Pontibacter sp. 172403-2]|uniref:hypothetical protein n=1 Tax=Pontibacter rufus TaxID=2791028 RepID=UPI0018AFBE4D|nr:hypothetical protein [Pontibacter sp. 172403-2]MBF9253952.1 hypothetical protein [Pontibacter sp. 172403-2]